RGPPDRPFRDTYPQNCGGQPPDPAIPSCCTPVPGAWEGRDLLRVVYSPTPAAGAATIHARGPKGQWKGTRPGCYCKGRDRALGSGPSVSVTRSTSVAAVAGSFRQKLIETVTET